MADEWLKFGMVERITLGFILLFMGALLYALTATLIKNAGNWTAETALAFEWLFLLHLAAVAFLGVGGPAIRSGWARVKPRVERRIRSMS